MSLESNRQLIRRMFSEIDNLHFSALDGICAENYKLHFPGVPVPLDVAATKGLFGAFLAAFPGLTHSIEDMIADEDGVTVRLLIREHRRRNFRESPTPARRSR